MTGERGHCEFPMLSIVRKHTIEKLVKKRPDPQTMITNYLKINSTYNEIIKENRIVPKKASISLMR